MSDSHKRVRNLTVAIGIPGAGKSTWVKEVFLKQYPATKLVSTDEIRKEHNGTGACDPDENDKIHMEAVDRARQYLKDGYSVVVDATNVGIPDWYEYYKIAHDPEVYGDGLILTTAKVFDVPPEEAMQRQIKRGRVVPMPVLEEKWLKLSRSKVALPCFFNFIN